MLLYEIYTRTKLNNQPKTITKNTISNVISQSTWFQHRQYLQTLKHRLKRKKECVVENIYKRLLLKRRHRDGDILMRIQISKIVLFFNLLVWLKHDFHLLWWKELSRDASVMYFGDFCESLTIFQHANLLKFFLA